jgi:hypothetical protein
MLVSWLPDFHVLPPAQAWSLTCFLAACAVGAQGWRLRRFQPGRDAPPVSGWIVFDLAFVFVAFDCVPRLASAVPGSPILLAGLFSWRLLVAGIFGLYQAQVPRMRAALSWLLAEICFVLGAVWICTHYSPVWPRSQILIAVSGHAILVLVGMFSAWRARARPGQPPSHESARVGLLLIGALVLTHPWFSSVLVGTGDALLYRETLEDFLNQTKAGIWPPWVSQSEVAAFGAVFPFRFATYHYYFAWLLDTLTLRHLGVYAIQHLTIILSFVGGGWSMYAVLQRLCPGRPWIAFALALLYIASPAWLGVLYGFTMIFTVMTLPFVPWALAGIRPNPQSGGWSGAVMHGAALAATWHAHPPVGLWVSLIVALAQLIGWIVDWPGLRAVWRQAATWGVCAVLCSGLWFSIASLQFSKPPANDSPPSELIMPIMRSQFPATLLPASNSPGGLPDIQVGYALLGALLVAAAALVSRPKQLMGYLLPAVLLVLLINPVPWITGALWDAMPRTIPGITGPWPVQRLVGPLAALAAAAGMIGLSHFAARSRRWRYLMVGLICFMLAWSAREAGKYIRRGTVTTAPEVLSISLGRRENSPLLSNWLAFHNHNLPAVYKIGSVYDAQLYNRVLAPDKASVLQDNYASVLQAPSSSPAVSANAVTLGAGVWNLMPGFEFGPGRRYLLELSPTSQTVPGNFIMSSIDFQRYDLNLRAGGPSSILPFWTSTANPQSVQLIYLPTEQDRASKPVENFLTYRVVPYDPTTLPVRIDSYAPYKASVTTEAGGWLETHRLFTEGYRATVNGRIVAATMSPDFRVMVPLQAGMNHIRLDYVGSPWLRISYGVMAACWAIVGSWWLVRLALNHPLTGPGGQREPA